MRGVLASTSIAKFVRADLWFRNIRDGNGDTIDVTIMAYPGAKILPPPHRRGMCRLLDELYVADLEFVIVQAGANDIKRDDLNHHQHAVHAYSAALQGLRQRMGPDAVLFVSGAVSYTSFSF